MKILLVAGHGAGDPGANGGGYNERDVMRQLAREVKVLIPDAVDVYDATRDMFQDTNRGSGMSTTKYKEVIELHMDAAGDTTVSGGHVIIHKGFMPDALDKRLSDAIKNTVGIKGQFKTTGGFSYRNNLLNLNVAAQRGISYRLLELGFITNARDRGVVINSVDEFAIQLASAIVGKNIATTPIQPAKKEVKALKLNSTARKDIQKLVNFAVAKGLFTKKMTDAELEKASDDELLSKLTSYYARKEMQ